jgi:hypothetical protein
MLSITDHVWNRAALAAGGTNPGLGDRCLSALLSLHGCAMNGGIHHALEVLDASEVDSAVAGFEYFGLTELATFLRDRAQDPDLREWTDESEAPANERYAELVHDDEYLIQRFEAVFRVRPGDFAPVDEDPEPRLR